MEKRGKRALFESGKGKGKGSGQKGQRPKFEDLQPSCPARLFERHCSLMQIGCSEIFCPVWHFVEAFHPSPAAVKDHEAEREECKN